MVCIKILLSRWMQSWPPAETFLAVSGKYIKFILFSKSPFSIFPQYVPLDMRNSVITTSLKRFDESPETLRSMYKKIKKIMKFKEMICLKILWSRWMQSWPPRRSFPRSLKEWYKTYTFFEKSFFVFSLITFLWTRRMRWLQPRWRVVDKRPKIFRSKYKNGKKTYNSKKWSA